MTQSTIATPDSETYAQFSIFDLLHFIRRRRAVLALSSLAGLALGFFYCSVRVVHFVCTTSFESVAAILEEPREPSTVEAALGIAFSKIEFDEKFSSSIVKSLTDHLAPTNQSMADAFAPSSRAAMGVFSRQFDTKEPSATASSLAAALKQSNETGAPMQLPGSNFYMTIRAQDSGHYQIAMSVDDPESGPALSDAVAAAFREVIPDYNIQQKKLADTRSDVQTKATERIFLEAFAKASERTRALQVQRMQIGSDLFSLQRELSDMAGERSKAGLNLMGGSVTVNPADVEGMLNASIVHLTSLLKSDRKLDAKAQAEILARLARFDEMRAQTSRKMDVESRQYDSLDTRYKKVMEATRGRLDAMDPKIPTLSPLQTKEYLEPEKACLRAAAVPSTGVVLLSTGAGLALAATATALLEILRKARKGLFRAS